MEVFYGVFSYFSSNKFDVFYCDILIFDVISAENESHIILEVNFL